MSGAPTESFGLLGSALSPMVDIFHINLGKRTNACDILGKNLGKHKNAIVSINEPPTDLKPIVGLGTPFFRKSENKPTRAAVYIKGNQFKGILLSHLSTPDLTVVNITGSCSTFTVISAYLPPYDSEYQKHLSELQLAISSMRPDEKIIICSDSNARNTLWSDEITNRRGNEFETFIATNELLLLNTEGPFTYSQSEGNEKRIKSRAKSLKTSKNENPRESQGKSVIDLILANYNMMDFNPKTEVLLIYSGSDHRMVRTGIEIKAAPGPNNQHNPFRNTTRIYRTDKADWLTFEQTLDRNLNKIESTNFNITNSDEADSVIQVLNDYLEEACDAAIPRLKHTSERKQNQNDEIDKLTKKEYSLARKVRKLNGKNAFLARKAEEELKNTQRLKTVALNKHRKDCFEKVCTEASHQSGAYKLHNNCKAKFTRRCPATILDMDGKPTLNSNETTEKLFKHCFPDRNHPKPQKQTRVSDYEPINLITAGEIEQTIRWMGNNKAPGIDGFSPVIIKRSLTKILQPLTTLLNALLRINYFPRKWKKGFAIFIPKPNSKDGTKTVKDFRPITLLNVLAKLFEKLIIIRINKHMYSNNKMSDNQEGFRHQRGTGQALHSFRNFILKNRNKKRSTVAVFLDISGAFDNACWQLIVSSLGKSDCPKYLINSIISYFEDREITTNSQNSQLKKILTQGCPQGSCCGPSLWNILLNNIFEIDEIKNQLGRDDFLIKAFADDVAIAFAFQEEMRGKAKIETKIETTLNAIHAWGKRSFLNFNEKKTQAILFKHKHSTQIPKVRMNGYTMKLETKVKYLGIWLDSELTFLEHATTTVDKCKKIFNIMRCYSGKMWGLSPALTRLIYRTIIIPTLTYGASIWYPALSNEKVCNKIRTLQYNCCKSIVQSFRTASIISTNLLSNTLPLEYEILIRSNIELTRVTGNYSPQTLDGRLVDLKTYKPQRELFSAGYLLENFDRECNIIDTTKPSKSLIGDPNKPRIEPRIRWADLPIGTQQAKINITDYSPENKSFDYYIFTDGSKTGNYGTGCGFIIAQNTGTIAEASIPLHPQCSVAQAEIFAILQSLIFLNRTQAIDYAKILLCTDSESTLYSLKNIFSDNLVRFQIDQTLSVINQRNARVFFAKVKAHTGIKGNEDADKCAKFASSVSAEWGNQTHRMEPQFNFLPLSLIKLKTRNQFKNAWLARPYDRDFNDDRANLNDWTRNFIPDGKSIGEKLVELCDFFTTQIITRHGENMQYFSDFGIAEDNKCALHSDAVDSPDHILFHCNEKYTSTLKKMGIRTQEDLHKVLASDEKISIFKELCKTIVNERKELNHKILFEAREKKLAVKTIKTVGKNMASQKPPPQKNNPFYRLELEHDYCTRSHPEVQWLTKTSNPDKPHRIQKLTTHSGNNIANVNEPLLRKIKVQHKTLKDEKKAGKTKFANDGNIPTAYPAIETSEHSSVIISEKHGITTSSWLSGEQILNFSKNLQTENHANNHLIIDPLIFGLEGQLVEFLSANISTEIKFILAIIHSNGNHWLTGLINLNSKTIALVDSLGQTNHGTLFNKLYRIADISLSLLNRYHTFGEFTFNCSLDNPKQQNYNDCGLFVCKIISMIMKKDSSYFEIKTGQFRDELVRVLQYEREPNESRLRNRNQRLLNKFRQPNYINRLNACYFSSS